MPSNKAFSNRIQIIDERLRRRQRNWSMEDLLEAVNQRIAKAQGGALSIRTFYAAVKQEWLNTLLCLGLFRYEVNRRNLDYFFV